MKKVFFLTFLAFSNFAFSQFVLTKNGCVNSEDETKNYIVYNFEGKSAEYLYNQCLSTIIKMYVSGKDVVSKVENTTISVHGLEEKGICYGNVMGGCNRRFDLSYTFSIEFKDNKIKINGINVLDSRGDSYNPKNTYSLVGGGGMFGTYSTFGKDGKLKDKKSKESIENFFNPIVKKILEDLNNSANNDDW